MRNTDWSSSSLLRTKNNNNKGGTEWEGADKKRLWYMAWRYGVELEAEKRKLNWLSSISDAYKLVLRISHG